MKILSGALGVHEAALPIRARRMEVLAQNIANADTPRFKARDIDFRAVLEGVASQALEMRATHSRHFPVAQGMGEPGLMYRVPFNASADGNTVEMSVEQGRFGQAAADYQTTLRFLENRISSIRKVLKGE